MPQVVKKQYVSRDGEWVEVNGGGGSLSDHLAAADPHPQYATDVDVAEAEAAAKASFDATPIRLFMEATAQAIGNPDIIPYPHAYVELTPGFWIVEGGVGVWNQAVEDACWGALCDADADAAAVEIIPQSAGAQSVTTADIATAEEVRSSLVLIEVVSGTRVIHPCAFRNGTSSLITDAAPNGPQGWISAIRIRV